jgi:hypothetical protein
MVIGNGVILRKFNFPGKVSVQNGRNQCQAVARMPDAGALVDNGFFASDA